MIFLKDSHFWCLILGIVILMIIQYLIDDKGLIEGNAELVVEVEVGANANANANANADANAVTTPDANAVTTPDANAVTTPDANAVQPVDCVGSWGAWGACSASCGGGTRDRTYTITTPKVGSGSDCVAENGATDREECNTTACSAGDANAGTVAGAGDSGGANANTNADSNAGTDANAVTAPDANAVTAPDANAVTAPDANANAGANANTAPDANAGAAADANANAAADANANANADADANAVQPVDCEGSWSAWGDCSADCGGGTQQRTYTVTTEAANGGAACSDPHNHGQTRPCNTEACAAVDCVGDFPEWGACSVPCGGGTKRRSYEITTQAANGGAACQHAEGVQQTAPCNTHPCPIDCVGDFGAWSACSASCGDGKQQRTYNVSATAQHGGAACSNAHGHIEERDCNEGDCPAVNCVGSWSAWGACSEDCGGGTMERTYTVTTPRVGSGSECEAADGATESEECNTTACVVEPTTPDWCSDLCYIGEGPEKCYLANNREDCEGAYFGEGAGRGKKCHWNGSKCVYPGGGHSTTVNCPQTACPVGSGNSFGGVVDGMCGVSEQPGYVSISDLNNCMASLGNLEWEKRNGGGVNKREIMSWDSYSPGGRLDINKSGLNSNSGSKPFFDDICRSFGYNESVVNSREYGGTQIPDGYTGGSIITIQPPSTERTPENKDWRNWVWNSNGAGRKNYTKVKCLSDGETYTYTPAPPPPAPTSRRAEMERLEAEEAGW